MVAPEVHTPSRDIQDALRFDAQRPKLVETIPDWMNEAAVVRFGDRAIALESARLPRLEGIMGTAHLLRQGQNEFLRPLRTPASSTDEQKQAGAILIKSILELAGIAAGTAAAKKGKGKNAFLYLGGLGLALTGGAGLTLDLAGCTPAQVTEAPPGSPTALPATEMPVQVTLTPLSNEVVVGTPSAAPETPAPITGGSYPTEVSSLESPLVYSYGGETGRQNMNEYTRQLFDRYIAEMSRGGFLAGASVEELYRAFDNGYDFKLFTTDAGLTWLVQSKSDGSFLVPKDQHGQVFRDLQLSYDYLFQSGQAVGVDNDNFDLQRFQANKVGFVGAWPVLVNVDGNDVPVSWVNMEREGAVTPIVLASTTETAPAVPTAIPDSRVELTVGAETFKVTSDVLHSETVTNINIDPANAQKIGEVLVYTEASGRYIWNDEQQAWTPEFTTSLEYTKPELSPYVPMEAYFDGSAALSAQLYMAEHPGLIEADASYPHYMINFENSEGYHISLIPVNRNAFPADMITDISAKKNKPFEYLGLQQTKDSDGNIIYVVVKENWNPTPENEQQTLPTFHGFDKASYQEWIKYPLILKYLANDQTTVGQLLPVFPAPPGSYVEPTSTYAYWGQPPNPFVRALVGQEDAIRIFPVDVQQAIIAMNAKVGENYDPVANPKSISLAELPEGLSRMILYTGMESWR